MQNQFKESLIRTTVLVLSILHLIGLYFFYQELLVYKNQNQLSSILTYLNTHIANNYFSSQQNRNINTFQVKPEDDYCLRSDLYKYYHPSIRISGFDSNSNENGYLQLHSKYDINQKQHKKYQQTDLVPPKFTLPIQVTLPYTYYIQLVDSFIIGKSSICLFQKFNHLPQRHSLSHKNNLVNNYFKQIDALKAINASLDCIKNASYIPPTYRLYVKEECQEFFNYVNTETYKQKFIKDGPQFLTKMGMEIHRGKGVTIILDDELIKLNKKYANGTKCGLNHNLLIAQRYINNPFLYQGHKLEFRVYWVIASTNPLIVYSYGKEVIRKCGYKFDKFSKLRAVHLCNLSILKKDLKKQNIDYKTMSINEKGEELFIDWHLDGLQDMLLAQGRIKNKNWLRDYLYPKIHKSIIHAVRSAHYTFAKDSKLAEFFATDFMLTDELDVYILEINYNPQTVITTPHSIVQHTKMIQDMIEIQNVYLRSKYLRFKKIIQKLISKLNGKPFTKTIMTQKILEEIRLAYFDKLDQNIQLKQGNLFQKIIDENEYGTKQYNDLIQTKCLYEYY